MQAHDYISYENFFLRTRAKKLFINLRLNTRSRQAHHNAKHSLKTLERTNLLNTNAGEINMTWQIRCSKCNWMKIVRTQSFILQIFVAQRRARWDCCKKRECKDWIKQTHIWWFIEYLLIYFFTVLTWKQIRGTKKSISVVVNFMNLIFFIFIFIYTFYIH